MSRPSASPCPWLFVFSVSGRGLLRNLTSFYIIKFLVVFGLGILSNISSQYFPPPPLTLDFTSNQKPSMILDPFALVPWVLTSGSLVVDF